MMMMTTRSNSVKGDTKVQFVWWERGGIILAWLSIISLTCGGILVGFKAWQFLDNRITANEVNANALKTTVLTNHDTVLAALARIERAGEKQANETTAIREELLRMSNRLTRVETKLEERNNH